MGSWLKRSAVVALLAIGVWFYTRPDPISKLDIHGTWEPDFKPVADVFRELVKSGRLRGGSFAAYVDGKPAVNVWGGYTDEEYGLEWTKNTITGVASTTKFVAAIAFSTLIDKGLVNYDDLVSKHWPEFAQNGKENVTVNMLISHQAGLYALDKVVKFTDVVANPEKAEKILAEQRPAWPPGTAIGYHALTIGMYVDFLARKIDPKHRPVYQIYEEDIRKPLELDFRMNTPYSEQYRRARPKMPSAWDSLRYFIQVPSNRVMLMGAWGNQFLANLSKGMDKYQMDKLFVDPEVLATPIPAAGGSGTAVSLAKLFGFVAARTLVKGKPLLSERVVKKLNTISLTDTELLMRFHGSVGHGTFIFQNPWGQNVFGHPGAGGQMGYSDPTNKVGLAFVTNYLGAFSVNDDMRFVPLEKMLYECLGRKKR